MPMRSCLDLWKCPVPADPENYKPCPSFLAKAEDMGSHGYDYIILHNPKEMRTYLRIEDDEEKEPKRPWWPRPSRLRNVVNASDLEDDGVPVNDGPADKQETPKEKEPATLPADVPPAASVSKWDELMTKEQATVGTKWSDDEDDAWFDEDFKPYIPGQVADMFGVKSEQAPEKTPSTVVRIPLSTIAEEDESEDSDDNYASASEGETSEACVDTDDYDDCSVSDEEAEKGADDEPESDASDSSNGSTDDQAYDKSDNQDDDDSSAPTTPIEDNSDDDHKSDEPGPPSNNQDAYDDTWDTSDPRTQDLLCNLASMYTSRIHRMRREARDERAASAARILQLEAERDDALAAVQTSQVERNVAQSQLEDMTIDMQLLQRQLRQMQTLLVDQEEELRELRARGE